MIDLAFPLVYDDIPNNEIVVYRGMTLRDYFAAKAMQALYNDGIKHQATTQQIVYEAYKVADAMLKARTE